MKSLIKKDFLLLKNNITYFLIITVIFTIFSLTKTAFNIFFILPFITIMMFISTFSWEDFNNWDAYAITLPVGRKNIVKSKYISAVIVIIFSLIIGIVISLFTAIVSQNSFEIQDVLVELSGTILGLILVLAIWFPCIYKFGVEKGRIMLFVGMFSLAILGAIMFKLFDFTSTINFINSLENIWFVVIPLVMLIALIISYLISIKIYLKKEF